MVEEATPELTRRDMITIEREAAKAFPEDKVTFSKLFPDGEATALGAMVTAWLQETKSGKTDKPLSEWLDDPVALDEGDGVDAEEADPT